MIEALQNIDASLMLWLNGFHNNFFDVFMFTVSNKLVWIPLYISIFAVIVMRYGIKPKLLYIFPVLRLCMCICHPSDILSPATGQGRQSYIRPGPYRQQRSRRFVGIPVMSCR